LHLLHEKNDLLSSAIIGSQRGQTFQWGAASAPVEPHLSGVPRQNIWYSCSKFFIFWMSFQAPNQQNKSSKQEANNAF